MIFKNKTVFISGTNRGIGQALVHALLQRDVLRIYASARNVEQISNVTDERVIPVALDITNIKQVQAAADIATDTDILINNAGMATYDSMLEGSLEAVTQAMDTNYLGTLNMMRAFIPVLESREAPAIVNVVSIAAFVNFPFVGGYSASKAALFSISQGARLELAPKGIAVHTINPGPIDTDMAKPVDLDKMSAEDAATSSLDLLEQGQLDIFPDPIGADMFKMWRNDYRDLERAVSDMISAP